LALFLSAIVQLGVRAAFGALQIKESMGRDQVRNGPSQAGIKALAA